MSISSTCVGKIGALYSDKLQAKLQEAELSNWSLPMLMLAQANHTQPFTVDTILQQIPYMNPDTLANHMRQNGRKKSSSAKNGTGYQINEKGQSVLSDILQAVSTWIDRPVEVAGAEAVYQTLQQMSQGCQKRTRAGGKSGPRQHRLLFC